jgi:hypothetical protein
VHSLASEVLQSRGVPDTTLTPHEVREIAARAYCDPRTVRAYLSGRNQHSTTTKRIERAIAELRATSRFARASEEAP